MILPYECIDLFKCPPCDLELHHIKLNESNFNKKVLGRDPEVFYLSMTHASSQYHQYVRCMISQC